MNEKLKQTLDFRGDKKNTREDKPFFWNKQGNIRTKICLTTKEKSEKKTFEKIVEVNFLMIT